MEKVPWDNCLTIEECTDMGDTNGNCIDISVEEIDKRVITLDKAVVD